MKLRYLSIALGLSGLLAACDQPPSNTQNTEPATTVATVIDSSPVLATVNGEPITEAVFELYQQQMQARAPGNPAALNREAILNEVINLELARQSGEKEGVGKDTKVQLQIEQQKRAVLASAAIQQHMSEPITEAVFELYQQQMRARAPGNPAALNREAILNEVINLELARQSGEKEGVGKDTKVQLQIEQQKRAVLASAAIQQHMSAHPVTDEELKKIYDEQVPKGNEYKARHILVEEEDAAKKLIAELDKGADFSELAKEHSTGPSGKSGGELGWFSPKQMVAPFSEAAASLEKGAYTKEPVKTQFGWHIIILDDSRATTPPSFEQVKPQLQAFVQKQRVQQYITGLRESANIVMTTPPAAAAPQPEVAEQAASAEPAEPAESAESVKPADEKKDEPAGEESSGDEQK